VALKRLFAAAANTARTLTSTQMKIEREGLKRRKASPWSMNQLEGWGEQEDEMEDEIVKYVTLKTNGNAAEVTGFRGESRLNYTKQTK
jgi:hypothetical protein